MNLVMMDLNANGDSLAQTSCSICLELVGDQRTRSVARLHCGHDFHLGSFCFSLLFLSFFLSCAKIGCWIGYIGLNFWSMDAFGFIRTRDSLLVDVDPSVC